MPSEPRNPLYLLLLVVGFLFVVTALAYAVVPILEQKAIDAGNPPPQDDFRDALRADGWMWLLGELALLVVLGLASMALDRLRSLKSEREAATISAERSNEPPTRASGHYHGP
jgi:hypothetical protein